MTFEVTYIKPMPDNKIRVTVWFSEEVNEFITSAEVEVYLENREQGISQIKAESLAAAQKFLSGVGAARPTPSLPKRSE